MHNFLPQYTYSRIVYRNCKKKSRFEKYLHKLWNGVYRFTGLAGNAPARGNGNFMIYAMRRCGEVLLSFSALDTRGKHAAAILHDSTVLCK